MRQLPLDHTNGLIVIDFTISRSFHDQPWKSPTPSQPRMGRRPTKDPEVIDLVESDSDIEIICHKIPISDDEIPPKSGPSRLTTQQVRPPSSQQISTRPLTTTKTKRETSLRLCPPNPKAKGTFPPTVKTEPLANLAGGDHSVGQIAAGSDETDSDTTSEVDDRYDHAKVCDGFSFCLMVY